MAPIGDFALGSAFVGAKLLLLYWSCERERRSKREAVGSIGSIVIYPVKSCQGVPVDWCVLTPKGIRQERLVDRSFMFTKPDGAFISQRSHPKLAAVRVNADPDAITLHAPAGANLEPLRLPFEPPAGAGPVPVRVWSGNTVAVDCGEAAARWAEAYLDLPGARIVQAEPRLTYRPATPMAHLQDIVTWPQDAANFQDCTPVMLMSEATLGAVNDLVDPPVDVRNFRPNLLVTGAPGPYDEDHWPTLYVGETQMHALWLNERCKLTTVDPDLGEFRADRQPLQALTESRTLEGHRMPCVGVNLGLDVGGVIRIGDPVLVLRGEVP